MRRLLVFVLLFSVGVNNARAEPSVEDTLRYLNIYLEGLLYFELAEGPGGGDVSIGPESIKLEKATLTIPALHVHADDDQKETPGGYRIADIRDTPAGKWQGNDFPVIRCVNGVYHCITAWGHPVDEVEFGNTWNLLTSLRGDKGDRFIKAYNHLVEMVKRREGESDTSLDPFMN